MRSFRRAIEEARVEAGRESEPFTYYVRMDGTLNSKCADQYRKAGFDHLTLPTNRLWRGVKDVDAKLRILEELASELRL